MNASELALLEHNQLQKREMLGPYNRWITGVNLGHPPTDRECVRWYIEHGGAEDFRKRQQQNTQTF